MIAFWKMYFNFILSFLILVFIGIDTRLQIPYFIFNIIIALYITITFILLTNRVRFSIILTMLIGVGLRFVNYLKIKYWDSGFNLYDIFTFIEQSNAYIIYTFLSYQEITFLFLVIFLLFITFFLSPKFYETTILRRVTIIAITLTLNSALVHELKRVGSPMQSFIANNFGYDFRWYFSISKRYGSYASIVMCLPFLKTTKPLLKEDSKLILDRINLRMVTKKIENDLPDIVFLFNESTFNPSNLGYDFVNNLRFRIFESDIHTVLNGVLGVNIVGGGSWNSEYEMVTGIPAKTFLGPADLTFYYLAPFTKNSIFLFLKKFGYKTHVIYPFAKDFMNSNEGYKNLGADSVEDVYEMGYDPMNIYKIPDQIIFDQAYEILESSEDTGPKIIYALTTSNHGPHNRNHEDKIGCQKEISKNLCGCINDYISRLKQSDRAFKNISNRLMSRSKKTILIAFGDHMPSFDGEVGKLKYKPESNIKDFFNTFIHIKANFETKKYDFKYIDITFIPGLILDIANLNHDKFFAANSYMRELCYGDYKNCIMKSSPIYESYKALIVEQVKF